MARSINVRKRKHRVSLGTIKASYAMRTDQSVSATGASVAIRPRTTAVRLMNNKGQGSVVYV